MLQSGEERVQPKMRRALGRAAAALLFAAALCQARPRSRWSAWWGRWVSRRRRLPSAVGFGDFHGGGFHGGGFHGGGFHGGGFHGGGFHGGGFHGGGFYGGGFGVLGWPYYYPMAGIIIRTMAMTPANPAPPQIWYYCSDPAGYYPYVAQCNTGWQAVPAS